MQNNQKIQEIKERLPIEEVVSHYVKLEKTGINMKGLCPFHNEKSPSFFVAPHRGSFMCFGCGKKGDIFTFVQELEGLEFFDALKKLAEEAGVTLDTQHVDKKDSQNAYAILEKACLFFEKNLQTSIEAQEYLTRRGLQENTIKQFRIGYVPEGWHQLHDELKKTFSEKEILESGLVVKNEKGNIYDRFRDRIMFPIFDTQGKVIAFTGRVLHGETKEVPKYVNSPETQLFSKSHVLYGLNFAKQSVRKNNFIVLVEGQMDVIMTHQIGYTNTVASSGTAFTPDQLQIIKKQTSNLILAFDSDSAGLQTTAKVWEMAIAQEMDVKIAFYEGEKDPADIIKKDPELWKDIIRQSIHLIEFVGKLVSKIQDERKRIKAYQEKILPLLKKISTYSEKNFFINKISDLLSINSAIIWSDISLNTQEEMYQKRTYVQPDKIQYSSIVHTYITFFEKINTDIRTRLNTFLSEYELMSIEQDIVDEKKLFEIENEFETNSKVVKDSFKDYFSQYVLSQLRMKAKKLRSELHIHPQDEHKILKQIEMCKKMIHSIEAKDCQFINGMV
jgi:DNA primase